MKISVCMAVYHGEQFIDSQIRSILPQLSEGDELLISDDAPGGETERIVRDLAKENPCIRYLKGPGQGVIRNFESVLSKASGDVLFLCDQDDVWFPEKVQEVLSAMENGADLVLHDAVVTDGNLSETAGSFFLLHGSRKGLLQNILRNSYMGCCMAFRKEIRDKALPFPKNLPMHDQWLGLVAEKYGKTALLEKPLIYYRRHGGNVTGGQTTALQKLRWRLSVTGAILNL